MNPGRLTRNPIDYHDFHLVALAVGEVRIDELDESYCAEHHHGGGWRNCEIWADEHRETFDLLAQLEKTRELVEEIMATRASLAGADGETP